MQRRIAICTFGLILAVTSHSAQAVPTVDGVVNGFAEGYTTAYEFSYDVQDGLQDQSGGMLFTAESADGLTIYVGVIFPLTLNDNTYDEDDDPNRGDVPDATDGNDYRAEDWADQDHGHGEH